MQALYGVKPIFKSADGFKAKDMYLGNYAAYKQA